jgi:hypothetical protein
MSNPEALNFCLTNNHTMNMVSGPAEGYELGWGCDKCGKDEHDMKSLDISRYNCPICKVDLCVDCHNG